jgi:hypothetical protein
MKGATDRAEPAKDHRCFIADLAKIRKGESLRFDVAAIGCSGGKRYLGFTQNVPPNFEHFLSCGIPGILQISDWSQFVTSTPICMRPLLG